MTSKWLATLTVLILTLLPELLQSQGRWFENQLPVSDTSLFRISFADSLHGCLTGSDGTFLYTEDGGSVWTSRTIPAAYQVRECKLVSENVAWAFASTNDQSGLQRSILRTTNKGITWEIVNPPDTLPVYSAQFLSPTTGYLLSQYSCWATTDGASWERRGSISQNSLPGWLEFFDENNGYKGGGCGMVVGGKSEQTTDGGWTWTVTCSVSPPIVDIDIRYPDHFVNGRMGTIRSSSGGEYGSSAGIGLTWNAGQTYAGFSNWIPNPYKFGFALDSLNIWLLLSLGQVRHTTNGGATWREDTLAVPISEMLCDVYGHRFALGSGRLFHFDPNATAVEENNPQPRHFALHQNYPNPFNPSTTIQFTIPVGTYGRTSLRVFDLLGREVATLVNEVKQPGTHTVQWDASNQASGVYFYRLENPRHYQMKKMILTR